ncbi:hypothetical protein P691DRAFT_811475 [Macrolepiota fuliginosa MF-IS2]|uniref:Uncharacterized protein n=1 Tax=Macrolepiota fuliginosa MF-IS2 TaxID=1400762 RepID=A0A9P5XEJ0_9AGAR|nr:hypothetical protein P691DRAFT_811475 [Macrolepiota fuliginosa MF-IS2]
MSNAQYNHRASLLNGLRTGGVRSASANLPHTAAPGAAFNIPRYPSHSHSTSAFQEEEEDQLADMPQHFFNNRNAPMTSAVDGNHHFAHQQQTQYSANPNNLAFSPGFAHSNMMSPAVQNQAMSMQMLQLEMMRIQAQAIQNQQYQAELMAQAQLQQQIQNVTRRSQPSYNPPATAGPTNHAFDLRATALSAQARRANQADQLRAQLGLGPTPTTSDDQLPMTAALGGRFGSRSVSLNPPPNAGATRYANAEYEVTPPPPTPSYTTVISGGTSLGSPASNSIHPTSKSDSVSSWRRSGINHSVLYGNRAVSSPIVKITPAPENERISPPPGLSVNAHAKSRPQPLRFNPAVSQPLPAVTVIDTDEDGDADSSCSSGKTNSSPTTPRSSASSNDMPLSPREEASKKLYEGLGIGRPTSASPEQQQYPTVSIVSHRMASQPTRQPRGPPSGADELGPKNFATRIRRKAIGGLMDARERREVVEAF